MCDLTRQFRHRRTAALWVCVGIAFAACTGQSKPSSDDREARDDADGDESPTLPPGPGSTEDRTEPGQTGLRRLSKTEYNNTLSHLFGVSGELAALFPAEPSALGFDNVTKAQTTSTALVSAHAKAVDEVVTQILAGQTHTDAMWRMTCDPDREEACAGNLLQDLALKAWRRPPSDKDVGQLKDVFDDAKAQGLSGKAAMGQAITAVLMSPRFLYRIEQPAAEPGIKRLDPHEDATRLSYFLWSSTPDAELLEAAATGALDSVSDRRKQIDRMLRHPKARGFIANFLGQWLLLRKLRDHTVDPKIMTNWSPALAERMAKETEDFFAWSLQNGTVEDLILSRKAFHDDTLAAHYGVASAAATDEAKTASGGRQGLLAHASVLTATSHPTSTSPVLRGKFILEQLLCEDLPAPPANVSPLNETKIVGTVRERLEAHRSNPNCKSCHEIIDPMGFALESFDAVGRPRTHDEGKAIDTSGTLPEGQRFSNTQEMLKLLAKDERLPRCLTQQLYIFALGRPIAGAERDMDPAVLESLAQALQEPQGRLADLLIGIAEAPTFRYRRFD